MGGGAEGGECGVVKGEIAANGFVVAPAEAGQRGLAVSGLGHVHRPLTEPMMSKAPPRGVSNPAGQTLGRRGGPQSIQSLAVEIQVAPDCVVIAPTHLGQHGLAISGLGHIDRLAAELVVRKAPLSYALLPAILSRGWTHNH